MEINGEVSSNSGLGEHGFLEHVDGADHAGALVALSVLCLYALPEDGLILSDLGLLAIFPPRDRVLGDDTPQRVVLAGSVRLHGAQNTIVGQMQEQEQDKMTPCPR